MRKGGAGRPDEGRRDESRRDETRADETRGDETTGGVCNSVLDTNPRSVGVEGSGRGGWGSIKGGGRGRGTRLLLRRHQHGPRVPAVEVVHDGAHHHLHRHQPPKEVEDHEVQPVEEVRVRDPRPPRRHAVDTAPHDARPVLPCAQDVRRPDRREEVVEVGQHPHPMRRAVRLPLRQLRRLRDVGHAAAGPVEALEEVHADDGGGEPEQEDEHHDARHDRERGGQGHHHPPRALHVREQPHDPHDPERLGPDEEQPGDGEESAQPVDAVQGGRPVPAEERGGGGGVVVTKEIPRRRWRPKVLKKSPSHFKRKGAGSVRKAKRS